MPTQTHLLPKLIRNFYRRKKSPKLQPSPFFIFSQNQYINFTEKWRPKRSPTHLLSKLIRNFNRRKSRPKCSPIHLLFKLIRNFHRRKVHPKCSPTHLLSKWIHNFYHIKSRPKRRSKISRPICENSPNFVTLAPFFISLFSPFAFLAPIVSPIECVIKTSPLGAGSITVDLRQDISIRRPITSH
jgi:hypothetical protein